MKCALCLVILIGVVFGAEKADPQLIALQSNLQVAQSQVDMNLASSKLADYWKYKLQKEEERILKLSSPTDAALFKKTQKAWRDFAEAEAHYVADGYEGGTIQRFIWNTAVARLREDRIKQLQQYPENQ